MTRKRKVSETDEKKDKEIPLTELDCLRKIRELGKRDLMEVVYKILHEEKNPALLQLSEDWTHEELSRCYAHGSCHRGV